MSEEESRAFWDEIHAQAKQDYEKDLAKEKRHTRGPCEEKCCEDWLIAYWKKNYKNFRILENGRVLFGDEE